MKTQQDTAFTIAKLPESCCKKIQDFEHELNKQGFWNLSLVAYQIEKRVKPQKEECR